MNEKENRCLEDSEKILDGFKRGIYLKSKSLGDGIDG